MDEHGGFELVEPYRSLLQEAKAAAAAAWAGAIVGFLAGRSAYGERELLDEIVRRNKEDPMHGADVVDEFVLEALSGDL